MTHSPGPWKLRIDRGDTVIEDADGRPVIVDTAYYPVSPSNDDDYSLIAAAPDLLEALCELYDAADSMAYACNSSMCDEAAQKARIAMLKATHKSGTYPS